MLAGYTWAYTLSEHPMTNTESTVVRLLAAHRIAVVGMSEGRISGRIGAFLAAHGREVIPVNPMQSAVNGLRCYPSLADVPGKIDLVNVFRRPEFCAEVVRDAIAVGAGGVWLQSGIISDEAERLAAEAGLPFVQDRCIMVELSQGG
ncbi:MAG: CoA-binding protein [Phycisphaerales bacterium]|nr:CoA-binding protein [Phycisphaerales bacterium]